MCVILSFDVVRIFTIAISNFVFSVLTWLVWHQEIPKSKYLYSTL